MNIETLHNAAKNAIAAKKSLEERIAQNRSDWQATSALIREVWTNLGLDPTAFKVGDSSIICSKDGIKFDQEIQQNVSTLDEFQNKIESHLNTLTEKYNGAMKL
jgi:flagellar biosynthesis chaperone FliJ